MTPKKIKTSAGMETVDETVARAKAQLGDAYVAPKPVPVAKTGTTVITPSSLTPAPAPVVTPTPSPVVAPKLQADLEVAQEDALAQKLAAEKTTAEAGKTTALQAYLDQLKSQKGLSQLTAEQYGADGGVDAIAPELNDINDQIRREQLALRRAKEGIDKRGGGLEAGAIAEKGNLERESLAKQADLSIIQMAVQGRYDSAKEIADRAVQAQFEQQTQATEIAKFDYTENKDLFTKAEQREYDLLFSDRERKLEEAKQNKQDIYNLGLQVKAEGAPTSVMQSIFNAKTREEALTLSGNYLGLLDRQVKQSQLYTNSLQQQKLIAELNPTDTGNSGDLVAYGQQFAESGKLPSVSELKQSGLTVSQVTEYAKQAPKPNGAILSTNTGIKSSSISSGQEDGINALYDIQKKVADLKALDQERQKGVTSALFGKVFGSGDQQRYVDLRGEIVDLLARARTGAALTAQEEKFYADQLPGRVGQVGVIPGTGAGLFGTNSQNRIENFATKIQGTLDTKLSGTGTVIQGYSKVNVPSLGEKTVGEIVNIGDAQYRVLPDGTLTDII